MAKLTDDDKLDIVIKYGEGIIPSKLARKYNVNVSVITKVLRKYREEGIDGIKVKHTKKRYSQEFKNKLMNMVDNGEATDVVAYSNSLDPGTLRAWIKKRNAMKSEIVYNTSIEGISDTMADNEIKNEDLSTPLTDEERKELIELRKKNKQLEMENEILKKLRALVQQRMEQQKKKK